MKINVSLLEANAYIQNCKSDRLYHFENGVLRRIFGPKRAEVTGDWRTLHN
jgi:hypothetical protein